MLIAAAWLISSACASAADTASAMPVRQVIVVRRGWHIDVGFAAADLTPPLNSIAADLPSARYIFFGFGDMHYLLAKNHGSSSLAAALWPGRGIVLVTALTNTPQQGFGAEHVIELDLSGVDASDLQDWIWRSFVTSEGRAPVYRPGPYEGGLYYLASAGYSGLHTCNTWVAEALNAGHFKVHSKGVLFAGQLWSQVRRVARAQRRAPSLAPTSN
jgi:hypothetical protein